MQESTLALLGLGFGLGLLHALDADHIMAVSALASGSSSNNNAKNKTSQRSRGKTLFFCLQWAIGHGGILLLLGSLVIFAGVSIPEFVSYYAEKAVGFILVALGFWIFWQFYQKKLQLQVHSHNGMTHVHLANTSSNGQNKARHDHRPVLVGITHGLAGSAPVLALVPVAQAGQSWFGLVYVAMFSAGVVLTMVIFGLLFNTLQSTLENYSRRLFDYSRLFLATLSISFGGYWLFAA